ncbi:MAG: prolyl oligopeptidase family serine peptidase [Candidatus Zixiibacteriota bacterium]
MAKNGTPVDSLIFPDEGHGAAKRVNQLTQYRRMVEFFDTHLKGAKIKGSEET